MRCQQRRRSHFSSIWIALLLVFAAAIRVEAASIPGLERFEVPASGSYFLRYVPPGLPLDRPAPVVLFFHGSGGKPENYEGFVLGPARTAGCILVMPKSKSNLGWGDPADELTMTESLRMVREALPVDERHIAVAGHSAGGAYAYLLAYQTDLHFSAVFTMAAPFYPVATVADPDYKAPLRMYYGTADPNYYSGSYEALKQQWQRLGISWEEEILSGAQHRQIPEIPTTQGFQFLVSKSYPAASTACEPGPDHLCLANGRFRVEVTWRDFTGQTGVGSVAALSTADSGLFWFFDPSNWEIMVKVLDGCALNGHHWVFAAATTTVEYTLTVTDTLTGETAVYNNPLGKTAVTVTDTSALAGCP